MNRDWLGPLVRIVESWLDDTAYAADYERFLRRSVQQLSRAFKDPAREPSWSGELRYALDNLERTLMKVGAPARMNSSAEYSLPTEEQASEWLKMQGDEGIILKGTVERFTAEYLLAILQAQVDPQGLNMNAVLERVLRHVELRRKGCLALRSGGSRTDRWFERHDTAILLARGAREFNDLRYLNAAMKLIDWALPAHRRSVPPDLLVRYVLAVSEAQLAFEELL
jgi:hypothetical protein